MSFINFPLRIFKIKLIEYNKKLEELVEKD